MRLLLATNHLGLGGSESYLLTVAEQLDRLGHGVALFAAELGAGAEVAAERGVELVDAAGLSDELDAAIVQDAAVSYEVADRCPGLPQLFVAHSAMFDLQAPPQLPGLVAAIVALNDRVAARMRSFGLGTDVTRLRQPIDTERFVTEHELPSDAKRALLLSNTPHGDRLAMLEGACERAGLQLERLGGQGRQVTDTRPALAEVEIVIGYGRSILEAMACGRAAYVYDWKGGDGWVTADSYPALEADGFAGTALDVAVDADRLTADLGGYSHTMGPINRDLVISNHRANLHAQELVEMLRDLGVASERPRAPLDEMARLVRLEWRARVEASSLRSENARLHDDLHHSEERVGEAQRSAHAEAQRADEIVSIFERTLSWRLTRPLRWLSSLFSRNG